MVLGVLPQNSIISLDSGVAFHGFIKNFNCAKDFTEDGADLVDLYLGGPSEPMGQAEEIKNGRLAMFTAEGRKFLAPSSWCGNGDNGRLGPFSEAYSSGNVAADLANMQQNRKSELICVWWAMQRTLTQLMGKFSKVEFIEPVWIKVGAQIFARDSWNYLGNPDIIYAQSIQEVHVPHILDGDPTLSVTPVLRPLPSLFLLGRNCHLLVIIFHCLLFLLFLLHLFVFLTFPIFFCLLFFPIFLSSWGGEHFVHF
jgi:hypothetical protein